VNTMKRRSFLKGTLAGGVVAVAATSGLLRPAEVLAASWPKNAFTAKSVENALKDLFGTSATTASDAIKITAPIQAENGAVVPITASTTLPNVEAIAVVVEKNPSPLAASVDLTGASGYFRTKMKLGQTSPVHVVVKSGGKLYSAKQEIKVTTGGCGG